MTKLRTGLLKPFGPHNGGISEDDKDMRNGQVIYTENCDITSNSSYVTVSRTTTKAMSPTDEILAGTGISGKNYFIACARDRNTFRSTNGSYTTIVLTTEKFVHFWQNSTYLYMLDSGEDIHRILLSDVGQSDWTGYITQTDNTLPSGSGPYYTIALEDVTYLAYEENLYVINNSTGKINTSNTYDFISDKVVGMTKISNIIKIYQRNGQVLYWKGIDNTEVSEITDLGVEISNVAQVGSIDYIVSSGGMYYLNGYKIEPLFYNYYSDDLNSTKVAVSRLQGNQSLSYIKGIFYIAGQDNRLHLEDGTIEYGDTALITFGQKKKGQPYALNNFLTWASTGYKFKTIHGVYSTSYSSNTSYDNVYIAYKDSNGTFGVDRINISKGNLSANDIDGIIVYEHFEENPQQHKKANKIWIRCDLPDNRATLEVFYIDTSIESGDNMVKIGEVTGPFSRDSIQFEKQFYEITLAVRLKDGTGNSKSNGLKYYNITLEYDEIGDNYN